VFLGEFASARIYFEKEVTLYDSPECHLSGSVPDLKVTSLCWLASVLYFLGYVDQALQRSYQALTLARQIGNPFDIATALGYVAGIHRRRKEQQAAQELGESVIALAREHGFTQIIADETFYQGWALVEQGQAEQGVAQMQQSLTAILTTGAELGRLSRLVLLAEAHGKWGKPLEGLNMLVEALAIVEKTDRRDLEAELYRLYGELTIQQFKVQGSKFKVQNPQSAFRNPQLEAEECFLKAIEIARKQQAKSWELRATMSLARLWQQRDKRNEAHQMLSEVYNWFTEGFDTADLQDAKALLEALG
jgi:predicted ATPase